MPTALVLIPHPDDEAYSFAATMALLSGAGWECRVECASAGEKGKRHDGGPVAPADVAAVRKSELGASCRLVGAVPPRFWALPDGGLAALPSQADRIRSLCAELAPGLVLSLGADGAYGHPDHVALYRWIAEALEARISPLVTWLSAAFPVGLFLPQYEKCIGMMGDPPEPPPSAIGTGNFDVAVDIRGVRDAKEASIRAHRSQLPGGQVDALFPPGVVRQLLTVERFVVECGTAAGLPPLFTRKSRTGLDPCGFS